MADHENLHASEHATGGDQPIDVSNVDGNVEIKQEAASTAANAKTNQLRHFLDSENSNEESTIDDAGNVVTVHKWESVNGKLTPKAGTAPSGISFASEASEFSVEGEGGFTTVGSNLEYTTDNYRNGTIPQTLLIHSNTFDGDTTIDDSSVNELDPTTALENSTDQAKFGASSIENLNNGLLNFGGSSLFDIGADDFTFDCWLYFTSTSGNRNLFYKGLFTDLGFAIQVNGAKLSMKFSTNGSTFSINTTGTTVFSTGQWYHVAVVRLGNDYKGYIDGALEISGSMVGDINFNATEDGKAFDNFVGAFMDEMRFVTGLAAWTSPFTPPTTTYAQSSFTASDNTAQALLGVTGSPDIVPSTMRFISNLGVDQADSKFEISYNLDLAGFTAFMDPATFRALPDFTSVSSLDFELKWIDSCEADKVLITATSKEALILDESFSVYLDALLAFQMSTTTLTFPDGSEQKTSSGVVSTLDVSNPPTDAELDAEFGTPATVGAGYRRFIDDNGAGTNFYEAVSDGTNWWVTTFTKAV